MDGEEQTFTVFNRDLPDKLQTTMVVGLSDDLTAVL